MPDAIDYRGQPRKKPFDPGDTEYVLDEEEQSPDTAAPRPSETDREPNAESNGDASANFPSRPTVNPRATFDFQAHGYDPTKLTSIGARKIHAGEIRAATQAKKEQCALDIFDARERQRRDQDAAKLEQKTRGAETERTLRSRGADIFKNDLGEWEQKTDELGRPQFQPQTGETQYDNNSGAAYRVNRTRLGEQQPEFLDANAGIGTHPERPGELYRRNKNAAWDYLGTVEEGLRSADASVRSAAEAAKPKLDAELHKGAKAGFQAQRDEAVLHFGDQMREFQVRKKQSDDLDLQIQNVAADPKLNETEGGFLGTQIGARPTAAAQDLQTQLAKLKEQQNGISQTKPDLKAHRETLAGIKARQNSFDALVNQSDGDVSAAAQSWREQIATDGGDPTQDHVLQALSKQREKLGLPALDEAEQNKQAQRAAQLRHDPNFEQPFAKEEALRADLTSGKIKTRDELAARTNEVQQGYDTAVQQTTGRVSPEQLAAMSPEEKRAAVAKQQEIAQTQRDQTELQATLVTQLKKDRGFDDQQAAHALSAMNPDEMERLARRANVADFGGNSFSRAVAQGFASMGSSLANFTRIFADTDWAKKSAANLDAIAAQIPQEIASYKDIKSASDLASYAANALGNLAPTMATSMGAGLAVRGALSAIPAVARLAPAATRLGALAEKAREAGSVARAVALEQRAEKIAKLANQVGTWGTRGGAFIPSFAQEAGGIYGDQEKAGHVNGLAALGFGAMAGALDALAPAKIVQRLTKAGSLDAKRSLVRGIIVGFGKAAIEDGLLEGSTEGLQTIIEKAGLAVSGPGFQKVFSDPSTWTEVVDSALMGMIGGGGMGGVSGVQEARADRHAHAQAEADYQQKIKPAADVISALHGRLPKTEDLLAQTPEELSPAAANLGAPALAPQTKEKLRAADVEIGRLQTQLGDAEKDEDIGQRNALTMQLAQTQQGKLQLASNALIARDFETAAHEIEGMQPSPGEDPAQVEQAKAIARGMVKLATGAASTEDVQKAIKAGPVGASKTPGAEVEPGDEDLRALVHSQTPDGKPRVSIENGVPVIADAAIDRLEQLAPNAATLVRALHGKADERRAQIAHASTEAKQPLQAENPGDTTIPPVSATPAGAPRGATAEAKGAHAKLIDEVESHAAASIEKQHGQPLNDEARRSVRKAAEIIAPALARYEAAFKKGGIEWRLTRDPGEGLSLGAASHGPGNIRFKVADMLADANAERLRDPRQAAKLVQEEAVHSVVQQAIYERALAGGASHGEALARVDEEMAEFWHMLPESIRRKVRKIYEVDESVLLLPDEHLPEQNLSDAQLGHEAFRMWIQSEIEDRELTEQGDATLLRWLQKTFREVLKFLRNVIAELRSSGVSEEHLTALQELHDEVKKRLEEILVAAKKAHPYLEGNDGESNGRLPETGRAGSSSPATEPRGTGAASEVGTGGSSNSSPRVAADTAGAGGELGQGEIAGQAKLPDGVKPISGRDGVYDVPLNLITGILPNFKENADPKTGVVKGQQLRPDAVRPTYKRDGPPIDVWQRLDGRLIVTSGRHRLDLARRAGEPNIPARIFREADGATQAQMEARDAESNIRDGNGSRRDYAKYFRFSKITESQARDEGLLDRSPGQKGWVLGRDAAQGLFDAYLNGRLDREARLNEAKAVAIAQAAPSDEALQNVGLNYAILTNPNASAESVGERVKAASAFPQIREAVEHQQDELWGSDDHAMQAMNKAAEAAMALRAQVTREAGILRDAQNRNKVGAIELTDEMAGKLGISDKNNLDEIRNVLAWREAEVQRWQEWHLPKNADLMEQVKARVKVDSDKALAARATSKMPRLVALDRKRREGILTAAENVELERLERTAGQGFLDFFDTTKGSEPLRLEGETHARVDTDPRDQMALFQHSANSRDERVRAAFALRARHTTNLTYQQVVNGYLTPSEKRNLDLWTGVRDADEKLVQRGMLQDLVDKYRPDWEDWLNGYRLAQKEFAQRFERAAAEFGSGAVRSYMRPAPKNIERIIEKAYIEEGVLSGQRSMPEALARIKDVLGGTFVVRSQAEWQRLRTILQREFGIGDADLADKDVFKDSMAGPGYRDLKLRPRLTNGRRAEIIVMTPEMNAEKEDADRRGHALYEVVRRFQVLNNLQRDRETGEPFLTREQAAQLLNVSRQMNALWDKAWWNQDAATWSDSSRQAATARSQSDADISRVLPPGENPSGLLSGSREKTLEPSSPGTSAQGTSSLSVAENMNVVPGGNLADSSVVITTRTIRHFGTSVNVKPGDLRQVLWKAFDRESFEKTANARLVDLDKLISTKEVPAAVARAFGYLKARVDGLPDAPAKGRAPLEVYENSGTFTIIDGNATAQALMLAGWRRAPVKIVAKPALAARRTVNDPSQTGFDFDASADEAATYVKALLTEGHRKPREFAVAVQHDLGASASATAFELWQFARDEEPQLPRAAQKEFTLTGQEPNRREAITRQDNADTRPRSGNDAGERPALADDLGRVAGTQSDLLTEPAQPEPGQTAAGNGAESRVGVRAGSADSAGTAAPGASRSDAGRVQPSDWPARNRDRAGREAATAGDEEARRLAEVARRRSLAPEEQNHRIAPDETLAAGGAVTRTRSNLAAIRLLKQLEGENRNATPEEKKILASYVGWGGLSQALNDIEADKRRWIQPSYNYEGAYEKHRNWVEKWGPHYDELKSLLTPEEWEGAKTSTENAHYTSPEVIAKMWSAVDRFGFQGGRILEPAMGVGHFFGLMPDHIAENSDLLGVELDSISGRISQKLYPQASVQVKGFQDASIPDNSIDLAISNVPFAQVGVYDSAHDNPRLNLHNYFFAKALDKVKPGGVVAFITSAHTMDSAARQRAYIAERGELLGAIRLPHNAFKANAGTEVVTDIVFLRKADGRDVVPTEPWLTTKQVGSGVVNEKETPIFANEYFAAHPEMVLGKHALTGTMYRQGEYTVEPTAGELAEQLRTAFAQLPQNIAGDTDAQPDAPKETYVQGEWKPGQFVEQDGNLGVNDAGRFVPLAEWDEAFKEAANERKARAFIGLRDSYRDLIALMKSEEASDESIAVGQRELGRLYDAWVGKYGYLNTGRHKLLSTDPEYYLVLGLEHISRSFNDQGKPRIEFRKADVFTKRTVAPVRVPGEAANALDAMRISQSWKGALDLGWMSQLTGASEAEVKAELIQSGHVFENPQTGLIEPREYYLSGYVREKLAQARAAGQANPDYERNVRALEKVQPADVPIKDVSVRLGAGWIKPAVIESFARRLLSVAPQQYRRNGRNDLTAAYTHAGGQDSWSVRGGGAFDESTANTDTYSGGGFTALQLLEKSLNLKEPTVWRQVDKNHREVDNVATAAARIAQENIKREFAEFVKSEHEITTEIEGREETLPAWAVMEKLYNAAFNGHVDRNFDGSHLTLPGAAPHVLAPPENGGLRPHQKDGIWRAIQEGAAMLAHGVGTGKTNELIGTAAEWKRLGIAQKPMIVVQNATLEQFAASYLRMYPSANVLVATKQELEGSKRKAFMARIASGNWDAVIVAHSSFGLIPDDPGYERSFVSGQLGELEDAISQRIQELGEMGVFDGKQIERDPTVKQLSAIKRRWENKLARIADRAKDDVLTFQQLGVDALLIDEAHLFKKVPFYTKMERVAGLDQSSSERAYGLWLKLRYVQENHNGRNTVLATGTPITNTLAEAWNMVRLTYPKVLEEFHVETFDRFASAFGQNINSLEMSPTGKWRFRNRFAEFVNLPEFGKMLRSVFDIKMGEDLDLQRPELEGDGPQPVAVARTEPVRRYNDFLRGLYTKWENLAGDEKKELSYIPLVIYGVGKAATMDMRLIDPSAPDDSGSKVNAMIERAVGIYHDTAERRATQLIFADSYRQVSTDKLNAFADGEKPMLTDEGDAEQDDDKAEAALDESGKFNLYHDIKRKLVARGVPENEIGIITDAKNAAQREKLFDKMKTGDVRFLIGSTQKMGTGVNVQDRVIALHNLDAPWTPADLEQRNGRAWRSGNMHYRLGIPVKILNYGMEGTLDAGLFQILETKAKFIAQALTNREGARSVSDLTSSPEEYAAMLKAAFSGDPRQIQLVKLESDMRSLENERAGYESSLRQTQWKYRDALNEAKRALQGEDMPAREGRAASHVDGIEDLRPKSEQIGAAMDEPGLRFQIGDETINDEKTARARIDELVQTAKEKQTREAKTIGGGGFSDWKPILDGKIKGLDLSIRGKVLLEKMADSDALHHVFRAEASYAIGGTVLRNKGVTSNSGKAALDGLDGLRTYFHQRIEELERERNDSLARAAELKQTLDKPFQKQAQYDETRAALDQLHTEIETEAKPTAAEDGSDREATSLAARRTINDPAQRALDFAGEQTPNERIVHHIDLAKKIARSFSNIPGVERGDIEQRAKMALVKAAQHYTAEKGPFENYASVAIRNALKDYYGSQHRYTARYQTELDVPTGEEGEETRTAGIPDAGADVARDVAERETSDLLHQLIAELPPNLREVAESIRAGQTQEEIGGRLGMTKQGVGNRAKIAITRLRQKLGERGITGFQGGALNARATATAPTFKQDENDQVKFLIRFARENHMTLNELAGSNLFNQVAQSWREQHPRTEVTPNALQQLAARATTQPGAFDPYAAIRQLQELARGEIPGQRTIGAPDLAHSAESPEQMGVDQYYRNTTARQTFTAWRDTAATMISTDREGTMKAIINATVKGDGISAAQGLAAQKIKADLLQKYAETGDESFRRQASELELSYRLTKGNVARALASGIDLFKTPAERHREFLGRMILTPPKDVQKQLDEAKTSEERKKILDSDQKRVSAILAQLAKMGLTEQMLFGHQNRGAFVLAQLAGLSESDLAKLGDYFAKRNAGQTVSAEENARIKRILDALKQKGITEDDLVSNEWDFRLRGAQINQNQIGTFAGKENEVARMIVERKNLSAIMKATGLSKTQIDAVRQKARAAILDRHLEKIKTLASGAKLRDVLAARATAMSEEDAQTLANEMLDKLGWGEISDQPEFDMNNPMDVVKVARMVQGMGGGKFDMLYEAWINGILSGPQTQVANIAGNFGSAVWDMTVQRGMEAFTNALMVHDPKSAQFGEFKHIAKALFPGITRGLRLGALAWRTENDFFRHDVLGEPVAFEDFDKGGSVRASIPAKYGGRIIRVPGRALLWADSLFKGVIGQTQAAAEAYRIAKAEGHSGPAISARIQALMEEQGSEAWVRAVEKATDLTFQQPLKTANEGGNMIEDIAAKVQSMRGDNPLLGFLIPFVRTPFNIFRVGLRKTPLGSAPLLGDIAKGLYAVKDGKPYLTAHPTLVRDLAEQAIAWTTLALLYGATQGDPDDDDKQLLITSSTPHGLMKWGERELQNRAYGGDYVVRIGGRKGVTIPYGRYEPFATVIGTMADSLRQVKHWAKGRLGGQEALQAIWGYFVSEAQSKTFLQGIGSFLDTLQNSKNIGETAKKSALQAIVPNLIRQPLRAADAFVRDARGASDIYTMLPSSHVAEKRADVFGNEMTKGGNVISRLLFPAALKPYPELERMDKLLLHWNNENPSETWAPQPPTRTYKDAQGKLQTMSEGQYRSYSSKVGHRVIEELRGRLSQRQIDHPTEADVKLIRNAVEKARHDVKEELMTALRHGPMVAR